MYRRGGLALTSGPVDGVNGDGGVARDEASCAVGGLGPSISSSYPVKKAISFSAPQK